MEQVWPTLDPIFYSVLLLMFVDNLISLSGLCYRGSSFIHCTVKLQTLKSQTCWNKTFPFSVVKATGMEVAKDPSLEGTNLFCTSLIQKLLDLLVTTPQPGASFIFQAFVF